jgi:hypothetical protein
VNIDEPSEGKGTIMKSISHPPKSELKYGLEYFFLVFEIIVIVFVCLENRVEILGVFLSLFPCVVCFIRDVVFHSNLLYEYKYFSIFKNTFMSISTASTSHTRPSLINIYAKQKKDDVVDVIFDECAALDLSDLISDFIADRFNHLSTLFTVPQLRKLTTNQSK